MKILTINTHSILEKDYEKKCEYFKDAIIRIQPDIIAMQEVNQSKWAKTVDNPNYIGNMQIKSDNHALKISKMLENSKVNYFYNWLGIKFSYKIFEEGISIFSKKPIENVSELLLTEKDDVSDWRTRKAQLAKIGDMLICNVHMGWWDDNDAPFLKQFNVLNNHLSNINSQIFLMGDFNSPANEKNRGYETVINSGWFDTYTLANVKDSGYTVTKKIDGWETSEEKRIDYIFTNRKIPVKSSNVIFNREIENIISDHFGVIIEI